MRVIAGEFRSRRLRSLPGPHLRPTPDRLRETLFDILAPQIEGVAFLDAYAGTGAVGIEALSRGASEAIFIERSRAAVDLIRENLQSLGIETRAQVFCAKALAVLPRLKAEIVFLDPPYDLAAEYAAALELLGAAPPPLVIVQHDVRLDLREECGRLRRTRTVRQGDSVLSFYAEGS
jgi:16S rRNA (guanine(966)-N(2))-methyltransferase RsmD